MNLLHSIFALESRCQKQTDHVTCSQNIPVREKRNRARNLQSRAIPRSVPELRFVAKSQLCSHRLTSQDPPQVILYRAFMSHESCGVATSNKTFPELSTLDASFSTRNVPERNITGHLSSLATLMANSNLHLVPRGLCIHTTRQAIQIPCHVNRRVERPQCVLQPPAPLGADPLLDQQPRMVCSD